MCMGGLSGPCVSLSNHTCLSFRDAVWGGHRTSVPVEISQPWVGWELLHRARCKGQPARAQQNQRWAQRCRKIIHRLSSSAQKLKRLFVLENWKFCHLFILLSDQTCMSFFHRKISYLKMFHRSQVSKIASCFSWVFGIIDIKAGALLNSDMHFWKWMLRPL